MPDVRKESRVSWWQVVVHAGLAVSIAVTILAWGILALAKWKEDR